MKPAARRLGRGLGAFLDFGPAGEDGASFVSEAIGTEEPSVLSTSASAPPAASPAPAPPSPPPPRAPVLAASREPERAPPRPAATPAAAAPQVPPPADPEPAFVDDLVVDLTFGDVELE